MSNPTHALVQAEDAFHRLMAQQEERFRQHVEQRSEQLEKAIAEDTGECCKEFNQVLAGSTFTWPPFMGTLSTSPAIAKETSAILCGISFGKGLVKGQEGTGAQHLGWDNLSKDAKGWCKALLLAQAPSEATSDDLRELLTAKQFAAILADHRLPSTPRAVAEVTKEGELTDTRRGVDE